MVKTINRPCNHCGTEYKARTADIKRGWGKHCSKSCAASTNNKKTKNFSRWVSRNWTKKSQNDYVSRDDYTDPGDDMYWNSKDYLCTGTLKITKGASNE